MKNSSKIKLTTVEKLNQQQQGQVQKLQQLCFPQVDKQEAAEDFYHNESAHVLAFNQQRLVGWAGVHMTEQRYQSQQIKIGGYGICTHPDFRKVGIATRAAQRAITYLKKAKIEIGFLSVDIENKASIKLHKKFGFVLLPQKFSWINSLGEFKTDNGGMIAPLRSKELFKLILEEKQVLFVGYGYW